MECDFNKVKHSSGYKASANAFANPIHTWQEFPVAGENASETSKQHAPHSWLDAKHKANVDHPPEERSNHKKIQVSPKFSYVNGDIVGAIAWMVRHWMRSILRLIAKLPVVMFEDGTYGKVNPL